MDNEKLMPKPPVQNTKSDFYGVDKESEHSMEENMRNVNGKIFDITMTIREQYPELSKYLSEMPVTIPNEKNPKITLRQLNIYFDSLNELMNNYKLEHMKMCDEL